MSLKDRQKELANPLPGPQVLGHISGSDVNRLAAPKETVTTWTNSDGVEITLTEPPPPWEVADNQYAASDARRFVEVPPQWELHWINPRLLDSEGWRDWQALMASDHRVKVKVPTMVTPEGYIRRGGSGGDILCWMWKGWYESRRQQLVLRTREQTDSAISKQQGLKEEFKKGTFGPYVHLDEVKHPTHTMVEGKPLQQEN